MASKRDRLRGAQLTQLEAPAPLAEVEKAPLKRRKAREREPAGPRALRRKAGFRSLLLGQLDAGPVLAEVERELLSLPEERGALSALGTALARLRVRLAGDGWKARMREAELEAPVVEEAASEIAEAVAPVTAMPGVVSDGFKKVATLTAALEEMGVAREDFGFTVTFGSLMSEEDRDSAFSVSGVGLAELSHHLTKWFEQVGRSDFPLQVIDEGSGELRIFISET